MLKKKEVVPTPKRSRKILNTFKVVKRLRSIKKVAEKNPLRIKFNKQIEMARKLGLSENQIDQLKKQEAIVLNKTKILGYEREEKPFLLVIPPKVIHLNNQVNSSNRFDRSISFKTSNAGPNAPYFIYKIREESLKLKTSKERKLNEYEIASLIFHYYDDLKKMTKIKTDKGDLCFFIKQNSKATCCDENSKINAELFSETFVFCNL